jgi:2-methylcitrate dehydratase PrpD
MNESLTFAKHIFNINFEDIPRNVVDTTKRSLLDGIGVILAAGTLGEGCKQFVNLAKAGGGKAESTIIGFHTKVPAYMAAFANGSMAHALDFEDVIDRVHPNASTIPAALAVAEAAGNVSGKQLITAITLGSDIVARFGLSQTDAPTKYGWFPTPIFGSYGATTAASKLLGLSIEQIIAAF